MSHCLFQEALGRHHSLSTMPDLDCPACLQVYKTNYFYQGHSETQEMEMLATWHTLHEILDFLCISVPARENDSVTSFQRCQGAFSRCCPLVCIKVCSPL